jgi:hypothetical protein
MPEAMTKREAVRKLVDEVPDAELHAAERYLQYLRDQGDPLLRALMNAPEEDELMTEEERAAVEEAMEDVRAGHVVSDDELRRELDI